MKLPPTTPRGVIRELAKQPDLRMKIARGWIVVGSLVATFASVMAVAHFVYGVPIQNNDTGQPATSGEIIAVTSLFVAGGSFFVVMGILLRKWRLAEPNDR